MRLLRPAVFALFALALAANGQEPSAEPPAGEELFGTRSPIAAEPVAAATVHVEAGAALHAAPDPHAPVLRRVDLEVDLEVLESRGAWARVQWSEVRGWIRVPSAGEEPPADELPIAADLLLEAAEEARGWSPAADAERLRRARAILGAGATESRLGPFLLLTDLGRSAALERFSAVASHLPAAYRERLGVELRDDVEMAVVLFAEEERYREYEGDLELADLSVAGHAGRGVAALFVGGLPVDEVQTILVHELMHLLNRLALGRDLPAWLEEGLANDLAYCATGRDGTLQIGTLGGVETVRRANRQTTLIYVSGPRAALRSLERAQQERRLLPTALLLDLAWSEFVEPEGREDRYIQSTFFVRFLLDGRRQAYAASFRDWLGELAAGGGRDPGALGRRLGVPAERLDREFQAWIAAGSAP